MVSANNANYGWVPTRVLGGGHFETGPLRPLSSSNKVQVYPGDVMFQDSSGRFQPYPTAGNTSAAARLPFGVVAAVYDSNRRPLTFNQPGVGGPFALVSSAGFVEMYEDPDIIFRANASATCNFQDIGQFIEVRVCAPVTAAGRSGHGVTRTVANTAAGHVAKLYAISPQDGLGITSLNSGQTNQDVEVIFVRHAWRDGVRRFEVGASGAGD